MPAEELPRLHAGEEAVGDEAERGKARPLAWRQAEQRCDLPRQHQGDHLPEGERRRRQPRPAAPEGANADDEEGPGESEAEGHGGLREGRLHHSPSIPWARATATGLPDRPTRKLLLGKAYDALPADGALIVSEAISDDFGPIDRWTQTEVRSALRPDTPT